MGPSIMLISRKAACLVAATVLGAFVSGCSSVGDSIKGMVGAKAAPEPTLADRPPLVMPPQNAQLPVPGQASQTASASGASDQTKKQVSN
jgi:hypothetical protein